MQTLLRQVLKREAEQRLVARSADEPDGRLVDVLIASSGEPSLPEQTFGRLRWGGVCAFVGMNRKSVENLAEAYRDPRRGFVIEVEPAALHANVGGLRVSGFTPSGWCFTARKTSLIQAGDFSERFTYDVELTAQPDAPGGYIVTKRVPTEENLFWRLKRKFPGHDEASLAERARKLVHSVFPTFLTREAAILKILARHLPPEFRDRVPSCLAVETDARGMVTQMQMNWLRNGGKPLRQIEFARQAAELLAALHEHARVMHLDLRMDNIVITEDGVGFVDFGSAVRIGEDLGESPMVQTLFSEMMRTSQIQKMLGKMLERGDVTNEQMASVHGKVDKTVDAFYLAVQIAKPYGNPEVAQLIDYQPQSDEARRLKALTAAILRPKTPGTAEFKTAGRHPPGRTTHRTAFVGPRGRRGLSRTAASIHSRRHEPRQPAPCRPPHPEPQRPGLSSLGQPRRAHRRAARPRGDGRRHRCLPPGDRGGVCAARTTAFS